MQQGKKLTLREMEGDYRTYFNWSANVLMPIRPGAADIFLKENKATILKVSQKLLKQVNYVPAPIYRGIILRQPVDAIKPHKNFQYLSFSTDHSIAEHFANVNGFGSEIMNVSIQLGNYGYIIEYEPKITEILFHHYFLSLLPYDEAYSLLGMKGASEVESLKLQKEVTILQPSEPFTNITRKPK